MSSVRTPFNSNVLVTNIDDNFNLQPKENYDFNYDFFLYIFHASDPLGDEKLDGKL